MEVLTLGGKQFVKASKAAKDLGYATDYVGQLCRSGAVEAHLVGRTWYVNPDTVGAHRVEKKRSSRAKAREFARKTIEETRTLSIKQNTNKAQNIDIHYEGDYEDLLPEVKKIAIQSEKQIAPTFIDEEKNDEKGYEVLNRDKKILMSGAIPVYDVDEETTLTDVTILTPKIVRKKPQTHIDVRELTTKSDTEDENEVAIQYEKEQKGPSQTFLERLEASRGGSVDDAEVDLEKENSSKVGQRSKGSKQSYALILILLLLVLGGILSTFLETKMTYQNSEYHQSLSLYASWTKIISDKI